MKYIVRALKYFVYLWVILALIIAILMVAGFVEKDISKVFEHGYASLWQIAAMMAVFAAVYPRFGFSTRTAHFYGTPEEADAALANVMELHGYRLEKDENGVKSYIRRSPVARMVKMWEDRITVTHTLAGLEMEGLTKDMVRIVSGVEAASRGEDVS